MEGFKFSLGATVKDCITGMTGIVTGRADYLYGDTVFLVQKKGLDKEGGMADPLWFTVSRLEIA